MKKHLSTIILVTVLVVGLSLLLYPTFSDYWNYFHQSRAIATYQKEIEKLDDSDKQEALEKARQYNESLLGKENRLIMTEEEKEQYDSLLNLLGNGIMGYVEIPSISVSLPIYHGTAEEILQVGVGHIEGTSLPVGGESTHCVISGHRGLTSSKLFTDIDQMVEGDIFMIKTMGETFTYQVDQIRTVLPDDLNDINISQGMDYVTLVTCTPYGVNSHRLLVRGHRIANDDLAGVITNDAKQVPTLQVSAVVAILILILFTIISLIVRKKILFRFL